MRLSTLLLVGAFCFIPMLGCGGGGGDAGAPVAEQSEIEKFLAENPELDSDEANDMGSSEDEDEYEE